MSISIELGYIHEAFLWGFWIGYKHGATFGVFSFIHLYGTAIIVGPAPYNEIVLLFSRSKTSEQTSKEPEFKQSKSLLSTLERKLNADIKRLTDENAESEEAYASLAEAYETFAARYTSLVPLLTQLQGQKEKIPAQLNLEIKQLKSANAPLKQDSDTKLKDEEYASLLSRFHAQDKSSKQLEEYTSLLSRHYTLERTSTFFCC